MEKKKLIRIIAIAAACVVAVTASIVIPISIVNCNREEPPAETPDDGKPHEHTYSTEWSYDDTYHWHAATCGHTDEKKDKAVHDTKGTDGACSVCGYKPTVTPPPPVEVNASWDYISKLVDLSQIGNDETAYCATTFKSKVYKNGEYSETETADYYIVGAYSESTPTKFYLFDGKNKLGYVTAYYYSNSVKTYFSGKKGGIATNGLCMWIACESRVYCMTYWQHSNYANVCDKIMQTAADGGEIEITDTFNPNCRADFIYYRENPDGENDLTKYQLFVGENHDEHEIDSTHKITCKDKDGKDVVTNAYIVQYTAYVVDTPNVGVRTGLHQTATSLPTVKRIYALPDNITGFAVTESDLILSNGEKLFYYDWSKIIASGNSNSFKSLKGAEFEAYTVNGETVTVAGVNVYYIKPDFFIKNYEPVGKVKDLVVIGNTFYVM